MAHERIKPEFLFDEEKIKQLIQIAPECFEDGKINFETLRQNLGDWVQDEEDGDVEHFGLSWPGKKDARRLATLPPEGTLEPVYGEGLKADGTPDDDGVNDSKNIFIEGENLEVLKILQKSYANKIKMIYIDPPYNTGNDFVYDDDFTEPLQEYLRRTGQIDEEGKPLTTNKKSDGRFHSKWLSMMYPRLRLARNLLKEDGVIVIHIDKNEQNNLSLLLNEIFGEENKMGEIIWDKKNPKGDSTAIAYQHENILCYVKNKDTLTEKSQIQRDKKNAQKILDKAKKLYSKLGYEFLPDDLQEIVNKYGINKEDFKAFRIKFDLNTINDEFSNWIKNENFSGGEKAYSKLDNAGKPYQLVSMGWPNKKNAPKEYFIPLIHPITKKECPVPDKGWRNPPKTMQKLLEKELIVFGIDETIQPRRKYLLEENMRENIPSIISNGTSDDKLFSNWKIPFENPKPFKFSSELISYFTEENDIVLDFFAGSGSTGHACFELTNLGKKRNFILIQKDFATDEKSVAYKLGFEKISDITVKRLKKSIDSYEVKCGFNTYKVKLSNYKKWNNFHSTEVTNLEDSLDLFNSSPLRDDWNKNKLITELILMEGFPLDSSKNKSKLSSNEIMKVESEMVPNKLLICLDDEINEGLIEELNLDSTSIFICLDSAISNQNKLRLSDKGLIKTI